MNNDQDIIYCSRCGEAMNRNSRYCMKCGNLNYEHESNENMRSYMSDPDANSYQVGSGKIIGHQSKSEIKLNIATNIGNMILFFFLYFVLFLAIIGGSLVFIFKDNPLEFNTIIHSIFPFISIIASLLFLYSFSFSMLYTKCNKPWWAAIIPIYNLFVLADITFHKKIYGIICFIPIIGFIFMIVMFYKLGKQFRYNGSLTALFPIVMIPVIGLGAHPYEGVTFAPDGGSKVIERNYKYQKRFMITTILFLIIGIAMLIYANFNKVEKSSKLLGNTYYVYASKRFVKKIQKNMTQKEVICSDGEYISNTGVYYFYYSDLRRSGIYLPFSLLLDPIEGYVKVDNSNAFSIYFVSITDGTYGIPENLLSEIDSHSIIEMDRLDFDSDNFNTCTFEN